MSKRKAAISRGVHPVGVAERLKNAPPSRYVRGKAKPLVWCGPCDRYYKDACPEHGA